VVAPRATPGRGGSLGPVHGDGGVVRWLGDGELWRKPRTAGGGAY
jgi:hypothetical protein